jgi:hypothetical protein
MTSCRLRRVRFFFFFFFLSVGVGSPALGGCLDRPTVSEDPTVKTNFEATKQTSAGQVDLLFMIDNSTSMGDKQKLLSQAVPNLVNRRVQPNCLGADGVTPNGTQVDPTTLTCASGTPEFPAVRDMHIGIVSSSLGDFGVSNGGESAENSGYWTCPAHDYTVKDSSGAVTTHVGLESQNDHAQLLDRTNGFTPDSPATGNTGSSTYLAWFPSVPGNQGATAPAHAILVGGPDTVKGSLSADFESMVTGVQQFGCGYEGQLESWYQFLVQPDPWASIVVTNGVAQRVGVNTTVLQQRADFLRPQSLVAVIAVSDEDDSTVDPGALGGASWLFESGRKLPLPTAACATDPASPDCTSCGVILEQGQLASHPECAPGPGDTDVARYSGLMPPGTDNDNANVRFALMKKRFGVDPQYPIGRYVNGLVGTNGAFKVPDRQGEAIRGAGGSYAPSNDCTNPLYAAAQPDLSALSASVTTDQPVSPQDLKVLCQLTPGPRGPSQVFFGFIGGVPWQLLTHDPTNATADAGVAFIAQNGMDDIPETTWTQLIGANPEGYDYSGQSPYMQVSLTPRAGLQPPTASATADPFNGREWETDDGDLEYACTFDLPTPFECSAAAIAGDQPRTLPYDGLLSSICDCASTSSDPSTRPPLCTNPSDPYQQTRGKAYPGIRELTLVHAMDQQQSKNGIAASLCPRTITTGSSDPNYGYNPAVDVVIAKLKSALGSTCIPRDLTLTGGQAPCTVLELLPTEGLEDDLPGDCDPSKGLSVPLPEVLAQYRSEQEESGNGDATDALTKRTVCQLGQLAAPCFANDAPGWCYETAGQDPTLGTCPQAVKISGTGAVPGALVSISCVESETGLPDAGPTAKR